MDPKYLLDFLRDPDSKPNDRDVAEYRLVCSGLMYAGENPWQNVSARFLLRSPVTLVAAAPLLDARKSYPQELSLILSTQKVKGMDRSFEIVHDIAAVLSLVCRRLITVAGQVSAKDYIVMPDKTVVPRTVPVAIATQAKFEYWPYQPVSQVDHPSNPNLNHYEPLVMTFESERITKILLALPLIQHAERVVLAARLYWAAMTAMYERVDIAYVLMTMSVEALANQAVEAYHKDDNALKSVPENVAATCKQLGIDDEAARNAWASVAKPGPNYKFARFMKDHVTDDLWTKRDDLFHIASSILAMIQLRQKDFGKTMAEVYSQRSQFVHHGKPYPAVIELGRSEYSSSDASLALLGVNRFPPFVWFERAVHLALVNYIEKQIAVATLAIEQGSGAGPSSPPAQPPT